MGCVIRWGCMACGLGYGWGGYIIYEMGLWGCEWAVDEMDDGGG